MRVDQRPVLGVMVNCHMFASRYRNRRLSTELMGLHGSKRELYHIQHERSVVKTLLLRVHTLITEESDQEKELDHTYKNCLEGQWVH